MKLTAQTFPELFELQSIVDETRGLAKTEVLCTVRCGEHEFPVTAVTFERNPDPALPTLALFGGVHGLERIGAQVVLAYMRTWARYLEWDPSTQGLLDGVRLVFVPIVNPAGVFMETRSNANGVDLMRNSPVDSPERKSGLHVYRGHRISPRLPWYRGEAGAPMQPEARAVAEFVRRRLFPSSLALCMDVHSGFGAVDRVWFPYARERKLFPDVDRAYALKRLLDHTLPNHVYAFEPQSQVYTVHGDLWDYLYDQSREGGGDRLFLPLTLEMGSWNWLKKNPFSLFRTRALFHPLKQHRVRRVLRRHGSLFDFLLRATSSSSRWSRLPAPDRAHCLESAHLLWPKR